jgi:hypothetical protein
MEDSSFGENQLERYQGQEASQGLLRCALTSSDTSRLLSGENKKTKRFHPRGVRTFYLQILRKSLSGECIHRSRLRLRAQSAHAKKVAIARELGSGTSPPPLPPVVNVVATRNPRCRIPLSEGVALKGRQEVINPWSNCQLPPRIPLEFSPLVLPKPIHQELSLYSKAFPVNAKTPYAFPPPACVTSAGPICPLYTAVFASVPLATGVGGVLLSGWIG